MGLKVDLQRDWTYIESKLPSTWRALAAEHGVLREYRADLGAKISDVGVLLRLILHYVTIGGSLRATTAQAAAIGLVSVSASALHKWMCKAGDWLAAMLSAAIESASMFRPERWSGYEVIATDASCVQRPGAKGTTARLHVALRLFDLRPVSVLVTGVEVGESLRNFEMRAGQLWLGDRGYCNANSIAHAVAHRADVLIRFAFGPLPVFKHTGQPLDVRALLPKLSRPGRIREWSAWVHPASGKAIQGRIVAVRLPPPQAEKARERLIREHGRKHVTELMLELSNYVVLFTTAPKARLDSTQLIELYRMRWQIELNFKRDKSIAGLDELPNFKDDTIRSWICAKMLAIYLSRRLAEPDSELFPPYLVGFFTLSPSGFLHG